MDAIVEAAIRKWPNVPHCYGWLGLDCRGDWYLRDERCQAAGAFAQSKGSRIEHAGFREFIERNYAHDADGCWFFQNGPQRVYVELEAAPRVWRIEPQLKQLSGHDGRSAVYRSAWLDDSDRLFVDTDRGFGLVHTQDMGLAAQLVESGRWSPQVVPFARMPATFGYVLQPTPRRT